MASGVKIALMFALVTAMVMTAKGGNLTVSCTNKYCKPITVNGGVVEVGLTVDIQVGNVLRTLRYGVLDILGNMVTCTCNLPLGVTGVAILELDEDLVVEVTACISPSLLDSILCRCPNPTALSCVIEPLPQPNSQVTFTYNSPSTPL